MKFWMGLAVSVDLGTKTMEKLKRRTGFNPGKGPT
jgi:hypothetical protein